MELSFAILPTMLTDVFQCEDCSEISLDDLVLSSYGCDKILQCKQLCCNKFSFNYVNGEM